MGEGEELVKQTLKTADNTKDVLTVLNGQYKIKKELNEDAMEEIRPYIEQGV